MLWAGVMAQVEEVRGALNSACWYTPNREDMIIMMIPRKTRLPLMLLRRKQLRSDHCTTKWAPSHALKRQPPHPLHACSVLLFHSQIRLYQASAVSCVNAEPTLQAMIASQGTMLLMWLTRDFNGKAGWSALLPNPSYASDGTVAIVFAILLFVLRPEGPPIMDWDSIAK
jgi:hypothetical protein